jgi:hypothetical protein
MIDYKNEIGNENENFLTSLFNGYMMTREKPSSLLRRTIEFV